MDKSCKLSKTVEVFQWVDFTDVESKNLQKEQVSKINIPKNIGKQMQVETHFGYFWINWK